AGTTPSRMCETARQYRGRLAIRWCFATEAERGESSVTTHLKCRSERQSQGIGSQPSWLERERVDLALRRYVAAAGDHRRNLRGARLPVHESVVDVSEDLVLSVDSF